MKHEGTAERESQLRISGFPPEEIPPTNTVCVVETLLMAVTHFFFINKPNQTTKLRKRENYSQPALWRAVMSVDC